MADSTLTRLFVVIRGAFFATAFVALWGWLAIAARRLDRRWPVTPPEWLRIPGMLVAVAGAALAAWCVALFVTRGRGTPAPFDPPLEFVAVGPYRFVRNPMYLGGFGLLLGAGLVLSSPSIIALAFVFLLLAHLLVVLYEEHALAARFGDSYGRYRSRVRRWLPC
jgi:protein-S-isoprenylcysteine O-methyltransferase Ste14